MKKLLSACLWLAAPLASFAGTTGGTAPALGPNLHPADQWEFAVESGYAWETGSNTSINYEIVPTQFVLRSPVMFNLFEGSEGSRLVVRNRFALLTESIVQGPENFYIGLTAAPSLEYWFPGQKTSLFLAVGGGVGWTDSTYVYDGQGQDFTLNWFAELGVRREIATNLSVLGSVYFLHHSNGGQTDPNPGIDATGFKIGLGWRW